MDGFFVFLILLILVAFAMWHLGKAEGRHEAYKSYVAASKDESSGGGEEKVRSGDDEDYHKEDENADDEALKEAQSVADSESSVLPVISPRVSLDEAIDIAVNGLRYRYGLSTWSYEVVKAKIGYDKPVMLYTVWVAFRLYNFFGIPREEVKYTAYVDAMSGKLVGVEKGFE